ncbi:MAG: mycothiol synthase [Candidatus Nanopelagicus sp.]
MLALNRLSDQQQQSVLALVKSATDFDQIQPISDHILLHLRHGGDKEDSHLLIFDENNQDNKLIGYAHLDQTDQVAGPSVELVVDPSYRNAGVGKALLEKAIQICGNNLRLWSHGDLPVASKLAQSNNFQRVRTVLQMSKQLDQITPVRLVDPNIKVRSFLPSLDDQAWLQLNNKVFANHPEQGNWSLNDLKLRQKEDWFDEAGFFIAEKENKMIGFVWTKIHGSTTHAHDDQQSHDHAAIGEIYITGVDPDFEGIGLGKALTITGLNYLKYQGIENGLLYVDEENTSALALYKSLGFSQSGRDCLFKYKNPR